MRLDKFLSHLGFGSRKEVKELLKKTQVEVNQQRVKDGKYQLDLAEDHVTLDGETLRYQEFYYYVLHKPQGVISATTDRSHRTVLDLLKAEDYRSDLFPVGRLDKDTTGLLILTNDGAFSHQLLSPKKHVPKRYRAIVAGVMTAADIQAFREGLRIDGDELCLPAELEILRVLADTQESEIQLTITEGKYHQVKRMVKAVGKEVLTLHRETMGDFTLPADLARGTYRGMTPAELALLGVEN